MYPHLIYQSDPYRNQSDPGAKLNQVEVPIKIAVPKVIFLLEPVNIASDTWYVNIDLINAFFFHPYQG